MVAERFKRKRVLGVVGSPRRGGNTEVLVDEVLLGAEQAGAQVEKVILSELDIAPCRGCDGCVNIHQCVQQDDMQAVLGQMERSEVWVLGTPIYWWGPSAQFKAFLDRWYGAHRAVEFKGRRAIIAIPMEDTDEAVARCTVGMLAEVLAYLEMELFATVLAPGVHSPGAVRECPDVLAAARRAGREAVESARSQAQEGKETDSSSPEPEAFEELTVCVDDLSQMVGPRLIVTGAPIPLPQQEEVLIGRLKPQVTPPPDVDLVPHGGDQTGVSRHHARMSCGPDGWELEDLNSTNGTFLNGAQVLPGQRVRVRTGDVVRFGQLALLFYE